MLIAMGESGSKSGSRWDLLQGIVAEEGNWIAIRSCLSESKICSDPAVSRGNSAVLLPIKVSTSLMQYLTLISFFCTSIFTSCSIIFLQVIMFIALILKILGKEKNKEKSIKIFLLLDYP